MGGSSKPCRATFPRPVPVGAAPLRWGQTHRRRGAQGRAQPLRCLWVSGSNPWAAPSCSPHGQGAVSSPFIRGDVGEQCPPRGTKPGRTMGAGRRAARRPGCGTPGSPDPEEILLFFTCELKQTQAPVYFLVDCILEDGGGFPTPGSFNSSRAGLARPSPCSQRCLSARQDPARPRPPIIHV